MIDSDFNPQSAAGGSDKRGVQRPCENITVVKIQSNCTTSPVYKQVITGMDVITVKLYYHFTDNQSVL